MEYENKKLKEFEDFIRFRKIAIIGLGVSNIPLIDYMHEKKAKVTVFDDREFEKIPEEITKKIENYKFEYSFGKDNLKKLKVQVLWEILIKKLHFRFTGEKKNEKHKIFDHSAFIITYNFPFKWL